MRFVIGIDPGQSGGIAVNAGKLIEASKMPETERDIVDLLIEYRDNAFNMGLELICYLELVHSMPKQGVSSSFKFGKSYGTLIGILAALRIPYELVTPQKWQQAMGCMSRGDKNITKQKAQALFPQVPKITHAIADALLIAGYGQRLSQVREVA